jgi:hypothetical protein
VQIEGVDWSSPEGICSLGSDRGGFGVKVEVVVEAALVLTDSSYSNSRPRCFAALELLLLLHHIQPPAVGQEDLAEALALAGGMAAVAAAARFSI